MGETQAAEKTNAMREHEHDLGEEGIATKKRKRQRTIISCVECHRRKQKCDRLLPCGNCTLRSASHLCQYERKPNKDRSSSQQSRNYEESRGNPSPSPEENGTERPNTVKTEVSGSFGYVQARTNTALDVLEKLDLGDSMFAGKNECPEELEARLYNKIVLSFPPRPYVTLLARVFFAECNWIYGAINETIFNQMMDEWYQRCASGNPPRPLDSRLGQHRRKRTLAQFPALLFQVLAVGLQMLPREHYKQMAQMNFGREDFRTLSASYSKSSVELASSLTSTMATLPRIQAWLLRAGWLKCVGRSVESWHAIGQAIREAQELGIHKEPTKKGADNNVDLWHRELERRVWANLYCWDRFMAAILGRPTMINDKHCNALTPIDCFMPTDLSKCPPRPRGPLDAPSPFMKQIIEYKMAHIINEVEDLTLTSNPMNPDYEPFEKLHRKIMSLIETFPPALAVENRDTSHDALHPNLAPQTALLIATSFSLVLALHRPFIFTRNKSRVELAKAAIIILEAQVALHAALKEHLRVLYTFNFYTFDPACLFAAIVITSPQSLSTSVIERGMELIRKGVARMVALGSTVRLAEKGSAVLRVLLRKAEQSIATSSHRMAGSPSSTHTATSPHSLPPINSILTPPSSAYTPASSNSDHSYPANSNAASHEADLPMGQGLGPINQSALINGDFDGWFPSETDGMDGLGMDGLTFGVGLGEQTVDGGEGFWQNLLNMPFEQ